MSYKENEEINKAIMKLEEEFKSNGRVLIRPSGTESLIRGIIHLYISDDNGERDSN